MTANHSESTIDLTAWQGRRDTEEGPGPWRWHEAVRAYAPGAARGTVFVGFACDAGVARNHGRTGAAAGPQALRRAAANLPLGAERVLLDAGDVACVGDALEAAQVAYADRVADLLDDGHRVVGLGGGHEIAFGAFLGLAAHLAGAEMSDPRARRIGIVNLDAHFDLRAGAVASSGTPFRQIAEACGARGWPLAYYCLGISRFSNTRALFERAVALGVRHRLDEDLTASDLPGALDDLTAFVAGVDHVYLTLCLDVLPAAVAPGVSAPAARGVAVELVERLATHVARSGKLRLFDVAELCPPHDADGRTARTAARLVGAVVENWAEAPGSTEGSVRLRR